MSESKFSDEEIEQERRKSTSKRQNVDYDAIEAKRDLIKAVYTDSLEVFQAKVRAYGIDLDSERGKTIMAAYWTIRREPRR